MHRYSCGSRAPLASLAAVVAFLVAYAAWPRALPLAVYERETTAYLGRLYPGAQTHVACSRARWDDGYAAECLARVGDTMTATVCSPDGAGASCRFMTGVAAPTPFQICGGPCAR